ncbi:MAG: hypothetical protein HEQ37_15200 [Acidovorax sp.]|nr:hypothetical protein [Acidovorax sp.]
MRIPITKVLGVLSSGVSDQAIQFRNLALFTDEPVTRKALEQIATSRGQVVESYQTLEALDLSRARAKRFSRR